MKSSFSVVPEKILKWLHPIFVFLLLSPLWTGPGSLFVQFEFPLPKNSLYQVWLKLAEKHLDIVFPIYGSYRPQGLWFQQTLKYHRIINVFFFYVDFFLSFFSLFVLGQRGGNFIEVIDCNLWELFRSYTVNQTYSLNFINPVEKIYFVINRSRRI
jgi:hypothetical protein